MNIIIRVDASEKIGTGHVMRCLALAEELHRQGCRVHFICRAPPGLLGGMITGKGFSLSLLPAPEQQKNAEIENENYEAWLGLSQHDDAEQTIDALSPETPGWLIVDHYSLDARWEKKLRPHVGKIMVIDDLANRKHDCDLFLDQNFSSESKARYADLLPEHCRELLGPRYALLQAEYAQYHKSMIGRTGEIRRVLVFMGGSDSANITGMVLAALSTSELQHLAVDVVVGTNNPHRDKIIKLVEHRPNTNLHDFRPHLADLMSKADLAIGGGGMTTWERMCLGLPSLVICVAKNQEPACQALYKAGLINYLGFWTEINSAVLAEKLRVLLKSEEILRSQSLACQSLVDGLGAKRVAEVLHPCSRNDLRLRPAQKEDVFIYYDWVNDPMVRKNSFHPTSIPLDTHLDWFEKGLADLDTYMYVLEARGLPVGQVRFEFTGEEAEIHLSLDDLARGRGWGTCLVYLGITTLNNTKPSVINARVKDGNETSLGIFMRLGFEEQSSQQKNVRLFRLQSTKLGNPRNKGVKKQVKNDHCQ